MHYKQYTAFKRPFKAAILLAVCVAFLIASCREKGQPSSDLQLQKQKQQEDTVVNYDSLMIVLLEAQRSILENPQDLRRIPPLLEKAFDTISGTFLVVGRGVANPDFPQEAQNAARKNAAMNDGRRWALYCKAWRSGEIQPFTRQLTGEIAYSTVVFERLQNDTLLQLIQIPLGSIVLR